MSIISSNHDVVNYDPKKSSAFTGQRLSKITYKTDKESGVKKDSVCVSIPHITVEQIESDFVILQPHIRDFLASTQDAMIRVLVESGKTQIADDELSMESVVRYLEAESTGSRLTKESVNAWFDSTMNDMLIIAFAEKLGLSDQISAADEARINATVSAYKEKFAAMAGGKTSYAPELAEKLIKALELAPADDELACKFSARLEKMKVVATVDMLGL